MKFKDNVSNPMLTGAIRLMKDDPTDEHKQMFLGEVFKAEFLMPVRVSSEPFVDEKGNMQVENGTDAFFPMLANREGNQFYMAFSNREELEKWKGHTNYRTMACTYMDYEGILTSKDENGRYNPGAGFVIDPFGAKVVITKDMLANLMIRRDYNPPQND